MNNLMLRESILKTSLWMYGLVVYTGMNTKIMKNRNSSANIKGVFNNKIDLIFAICFCVNLVHQDCRIFMFAPSVFDLGFTVVVL